MPRNPNLYIYGVIVAGLAVFGGAVSTSPMGSDSAFWLYVAAALVGAALKVRLPGINGSYSLGFLFALYGLTHFSLSDTLIATLGGALVQSYWRTVKRPTPLQAGFNLGNLSLSVGGAWMAYHGLAAQQHFAALALAAAVYFFLNTILVSGVLSILEGQPLPTIAAHWYFWSFPYYLVGAMLIGLLPSQGVAVPAVAWLLLMPVLYLVHFFQGLDSPASGENESGAAKPAGLPRNAQLYAEAVIASGGALLVYSLLHAAWDEPARFLVFLAVSLVAAGCKLRLPGMTSTLSIGFVPLLIAAIEFPLGEALLMAALVGAMQCLWKAQNRPTSLQVLFNAACLCLGTALAHGVCAGLSVRPDTQALVVSVALATLILYGVNTLLVAAVLCLIQGRSLVTIWQLCYFWSFPYYLVGATVAGLLISISRSAGWWAALGLLPLLGLLFVSYRLQVQRVRPTQHQPATA